MLDNDTIDLICVLLCVMIDNQSHLHVAPCDLAPYFSDYFCWQWKKKYNINIYMYTAENHSWLQCIFIGYFRLAQNDGKKLMIYDDFLIQ